MADHERLTWKEYRFVYAEGFNQNERAWTLLYEFKRETLLPLLETHSVDYFLTLDEPEMVLVRIQLDQSTAVRLESALNDVVDSNEFFSRLDTTDWSPENDARARILSARENARRMGISFNGVPEGGWKIQGSQGIIIDKRPSAFAYRTNWIAAEDDLARKISEFSTFMTEVAGHFTKAYLTHFPDRPDDRWLQSLFIHLLLDSISIWHTEENEIREFPFI